MGYFQSMASHAVVTLIVFAVGRALWRGIGAESESRRIHGWYVLVWSVSGFGIGGLITPLAGGDSTNAVAACAGFGLLLGWLIGTLHGAVALVLRRDRGRTASPTKEPNSAPDVPD